MKKLCKLICGILLCLVVAGGIMVSVFVPAKAYPAELKGTVDIREFYTVGERLVIPEGVLLVDGKEYAATASVVLPSGVAVRTSMLDLDAVGSYKVQYSAQVGSKYYMDTVEFVVRKDTIALSGTGSFEILEESGWVNCTLGNMERISYNVPIDLSQLTKDDELISVMVNASETGRRDFEEYIIVLTDAYDSQNSIYVRVKAAINLDTNPNSSEYYTTYQAYVAADFNDRNQFVGLEGTSKLHRGDSYGRPIHNSFCNMTKVEAITHEMDALSLRWDNAEKAFYVTSPGFYEKPQVVADMDSTEHFSTNWSGFHNDMVYVSLYVKEVSTAANLTIKHIAGQPMVSDPVEDVTPPAITINYGEYSAENVPNAVIGKPYTVFGATAEDLHMSDATVGCKIYYNYTGSNPRLVTMSGNTFTPEYTGTYSIVYSAKDDFGNLQETVVNVDAVRSEDIAFTVEGGSTAAGVPVKIPAPVIALGNANTGHFKLTVTAVHGDTRQVVYQGLADNYVGNHRFMAVGQWTVEYTISDYSRTTTKTATWQVSAGESAVVEDFDSLNIDQYFVAGNTYILPQVSIASFEGDKVTYKPAKVKVVYGDKELLLQSNTFVPVYADGTQVQIVYYDEANMNACISGIRTVHEVVNADNKVDMTQLFLTDNATITVDKSSIAFTSSLDTQILLINKQGAENLSINFNLKGNKNFGKFHITLTDSADPSISVKITFENLYNMVSDVANGNTKMYINGDASRCYKLLASFGELNSTEFNLSYVNTATALKIESANAPITTCLNGQSFNGFPSKAVYITFEMDAVTGEAVTELKSINGQILSSAQTDLSIPRVHILDYYASSYGFNQTMTTLPAFGIDVISGYSAATVSVRMEDGTYIKDITGKELKNVDASVGYTFALSKYGKYIIQYSTKDRFGNKSDVIAATYSFVVEDTEKPVLELKGEIPKMVRLNDAFKMPEMVVSDDNTTNLPVHVVVIKPSGTYVKIDPATFVYTEKGTYTVILTVFDNAGNAARVSYYVEVI